MIDRKICWGNNILRSFFEEALFYEVVGSKSGNFYFMNSSDWTPMVGERRCRYMLRKPGSSKCPELFILIVLKGAIYTDTSFD